MKRGEILGYIYHDNSQKIHMFDSLQWGYLLECWMEQTILKWVGERDIEYIYHDNSHTKDTYVRLLTVGLLVGVLEGADYILKWIGDIYIYISIRVHI